MDHDQRFKILIQVFFQEFLLLFFRTWAERLDATAVEWLDKKFFRIRRKDTVKCSTPDSGRTAF